MKKGLSVVAMLVAGSLAGAAQAWSGVRALLVGGCHAVYDFVSPPFKLLSTTEELVRADLRQPIPFAAAQPTERSVRPVQDQRPALRLFTLPRVALAS